MGQLNGLFLYLQSLGEADLISKRNDTEAGNLRPNQSKRQSNNGEEPIYGNDFNIMSK